MGIPRQRKASGYVFAHWELGRYHHLSLQMSQNSHQLVITVTDYSPPLNLNQTYYIYTVSGCVIASVDLFSLLIILLRYQEQ